jgi:hypothetical protein
MVAVVTTFYSLNSVLYSVLITIFVVFALTLFACQTKYDFTGLGGYLIGFLAVLIVFGFLTTFMCVGANSNTCNVLNLVYAAIGALIFSFYIVYDTQRIIGGTHSEYQFEETEYIFAAIALYLDVINLFLSIMKIFGNNNSN